MTPDTGLAPTAEDVGAAQTIAQLDAIDGRARQRLQIVAGAKRVLNDEFFIAVMERLEIEYIEGWRKSHNLDEREHFHDKIEVLDEIKDTFESCVQGEKTATSTLDLSAQKRTLLTDKKPRYAT